MPLNHDVAAPLAYGLCDVFAHLGSRHKYIQQVDAARKRRVDGRLHLGKGLAIQVFAAQADNAGFLAGVSDLSVPHTYLHPAFKAFPFKRFFSTVYHNGIDTSTFFSVIGML